MSRLMDTPEGVRCRILSDDSTLLTIEGIYSFDDLVRIQNYLTVVQQRLNHRARVKSFPHKLRKRRNEPNRIEIR